MGYSFSNIQIKNNGRAVDVGRVLEVLTAGKNLRKVEAGEEADIIIAIHPGKEEGWATVVSDLFDQDYNALASYARGLSDAFQTEAMIVGCFDSDYLYLNLLDARKDADIWAASGHFPGGAPRRSNYNAWKDHVTDLSAFRGVMRKEHVFAEECLEELEPILFIPTSQSAQSVATVADATDFICYRYMLACNDKPDDPPRFELRKWQPSECHFVHPNLIDFLNHGGTSRGVAVFIGGEPFDTHMAEIEKVEIQMHGPNGGWVHLPVNMKKVDAENGLKGFCGTCSSIRIPKSIPEGLPEKKRMDLEHDRKIIVRFVLRRGYWQGEPCGKIQVCLIPLANKAGQAGTVLSIDPFIPF